MGLFGFKKVDNKDSNIFINNDVINAPDFANMPQNNVVGYNDAQQETPNTEITTNIEQNNPNESYSYPVDNSNTYTTDYNNQNSDVIMTINKDALVANQQYYQAQYTQESYQQSYYPNEFGSGQQEFNNNQQMYNEIPANQEMQYPAYEMPQMAYPQQEFSTPQPEFSTEQQNYYDTTIPINNHVEYNIQSNDYSQQDFSTNQYDYNSMPAGSPGQQEFSENNVDYNAQVYSDTSITPDAESAEAPSTIPEHTLESITTPRASKQVESNNADSSEVVGESVTANILQPITTGKEEFASQSIPGQEKIQQEEKTELQQYYDDEDDFILFDEESGPDLNISNAIKLFIDMLKQPFTTLIDNIKKYTKVSDSLVLTMWVTLFSVGLCLIGRIIAGIITPTINPVSGARKITIGISNLLNVSNYLPYFIGILLFGIGTILIVALVYYIASFIFSKGVHFSVYLATSALSTIPLILSFTIAYPILNILSSKLALAIFIFGLVFSIILFISSINRILRFKTKDLGTLYHAINVTIIVIVMMYIINILADQRIFDLFKLLG